METKPCPACGEPIAAMTATSMGASRCPHCGYGTWAGRITSPVIWILVALFALLCWIGR